MLSALFFAGTLYVYARYAEQPSRSRYLSVVAVFAAGLCAKPMLVTLPGVLLLLDLWPLRRRGLRALVLEKLPLFALSAAASVITVIAQRKAITLAARFSLEERLGNTLASYVRYLAATLYPVDLSISHTHAGVWSAGVLIGSGLLLAGITAVTLRLLPTRPWLAVGWLWYLGMLVPVIGLVQVGEQAMADRYMYLPSIGLFVMVAWGIPPLVPKFSGRDRVLAFIAIAVLALCGWLTRAQVQHWRNSQALWEHARELDPSDPLPLEVLGVLAEGEGRQADALGLYRRSIELNPRRQNPHYNLGNLLSWYGKPAEALGPLREAVRLRPDFAVAYEALGHVYRDLGEKRLALEAFERSTKLDPRVANAQYNLGIEYLHAGEPRKALEAFGAAARLQPDFVLAHVGLADSRAALGDREGAVAADERALALAREQGETELAQQIETHLVKLRAASLP